MGETEQSRKNYSRKAQDYENTMDDCFMRPLRQLILNTVNITDGQRVLDVACCTGNTRYAVERFVSLVDKDASCYSIEDKNVIGELAKHDTIVFGFPVYYSNLPKIAEEFISKNKDSFTGKKVFIIATKALHNAYGMGYARQIFINCGAEFIGSLQLKMPENIRDLWVTMLYTGKKLDRNMIRKADKKIAQAADMFKNGVHTKSGFTPLNYIVGTVLRWLPFLSEN